MSRPADMSVVIAAGGTGGHMVPAHALAVELSRRGHGVSLLTDRRGAGIPGLFSGVPAHVLHSGRMTGSPLTKAAAVLRIAANVGRARRILGRIAPAAVIGFGGYPALPGLLAARSLGLPTCIHEQNAVLGRVNRLLARSAAAVALSFDDTLKVPPPARARTAVTGNPVREDVARLAAEPYPPAADTLRLLVVGGSLGARVLADVVPEALALLPRSVTARLAVVQQCRAEDVERVGAAYAAAGIDAELGVYLEDMPERLRSAHLVIGRAGASTIAELTAAGRPAILVPLPIATDDHQTANAQRFAAAGAGWLVPQPAFAAAALAEQVRALAEAPERLAEAAAAAKALGRPDAAAALADLVERTALAHRRGGAASTRQARDAGPSVERREAAQ